MIKIVLDGAHAQALLSRPDLLAELASLKEVSKHEALPRFEPMAESREMVEAGLRRRQLAQEAAPMAEPGALASASRTLEELNALDPFTPVEIALGVWSVDAIWVLGSKAAGVFLSGRSTEVYHGIYTHGPDGVLWWWSPGSAHFLSAEEFEVPHGELGAEWCPWVALPVSDRLVGETPEEWLNRRAAFFKAEQGDTRLGIEQVSTPLAALTAEEPPEDVRATLLSLGSSDAVRACWLAGGLWPLAHALGYGQEEVNSILGMLSAIQLFTAEVMDVYHGKHQLPLQPFQPWMLKDPNEPLHTSSDPFTQDDDQ